MDNELKDNVILIVDGDKLDIFVDGATNSSGDFEAPGPFNYDVVVPWRTSASKEAVLSVPYKDVNSMDDASNPTSPNFAKFEVNLGSPDNTFDVRTRKEDGTTKFTAMKALDIYTEVEESKKALESPKFTGDVAKFMEEDSASFDDDSMEF